MALKIFLDESGDLGFRTDGASKYFVIGFVATRDENALKRCVKRIRQRKLKKKIKQLPEIKAHNSDKATRVRFLKDISKEDIEIYALILDKSTVFEHLHSVKKKLYNYVAGLILREIEIEDDDIHVIIDWRENSKLLRDDIDKYLKSVLGDGLDGRSVKVSHFDSKNNNGLQVADFICWSIFRRYESEDNEYYRVFEEKIVFENTIF